MPLNALNIAIECPKCGKRWQNIEELLKAYYRGYMAFSMLKIVNTSEAILSFSHFEGCNHRENWTIGGNGLSNPDNVERLNMSILTE